MPLLGALLLVFLAAGLLHLAPAPAALLFLAALGVMAQASVADEEAFLGWLFLLAVVGVVGAAGGASRSSHQRAPPLPCVDVTPMRVTHRLAQMLDPLPHHVVPFSHEPR